MHRSTTLDNGIRIVTEMIPHVRSVTIGYWYRVGSRDEGPGHHGISHLIEHMMFKGTARRSARDIAETIDAAGGQLNAYTSKEHTCYYARVLDTHLELAVDTLSDMLRHSRFDPVEIEKEKGVVIEEIKMIEDTPDEYVHDLFAEAVFGEHPLGKPILGNVASVRSIQREDFMWFLGHKYDGANLVVAAAGHVDHDELVKLVAAAFHDLPQGQVNGAVATVSGRSEPHRFIEKDTEQAHFCVGAIGLPRHHEDRYALYTLDVALGGGMSSRFFQQLREDRGLVYATYTYHSAFEETGLMAVYAGTSPGNASQVLSLIVEGVDDVLRHGIEEKELYRAKEQLKGSMMLGLEHSANRMSRIARMVLFDEEPISPDELVRRIDAVTTDDIVRAAHAVFGGGLTVAGIGPVDASVVPIS